MSIRKGNNIIAYGNLTVESMARNVGEIVYSSVPLDNGNYHLADGSVLSGSGDYAEFVSYMANLYNNSAKSPNVTIIGNLTNSNNVLSGFSTSGYAQIPLPNFTTADTWEMVFKFRINNIPSGDNYNLVAASANNSCFAITISSNIGMTIGDGDTGWTAYTGSTTLVANTDYWVKAKFTGSAYILSLSTDGTTYTTEATYTSSTKLPYSSSYNFNLGINRSGVLYAFDGSADLNESYINVNGARWWTGIIPTASFTDESLLQATVTLSVTGSCGKYVYDPINNTLRLPKLNGMLEATVTNNAVGSLIQAGLPPLYTQESGNHTHTSTTGSESAHTHSRGTMEIKGSFQGGKSGSAVSGAFTKASGADTYTTGTADSYTISFTASKNWTGSTSAGTSHTHTVTINSNGAHTHNLTWNPTVQSSNTVQPEVTRVLAYIVIKTIIKSTSVVNFDNYTYDLNQKADKDFSNVTFSQSAKHMLGRLFFPSNTYVDVSLPASGSTLTAPADGFYSCAISGTSGSSYMELWAGGLCATANFCGGWGATFLPVKAGDIVTVYYGGTSFTLQFFHFVYAESEV
jgi:hypothetical protein